MSEVNKIRGILNINMIFNNSTELFNEKITEYFSDKKDKPKENYKKLLEKVGGLDILIEKTPIYYFYLSTGDFIIIEKIDCGICKIYILWQTNSKLSELLTLTCKEINKKIKNWKNSSYKEIKKSKLKLSNNEKVMIYPMYKSEAQIIETENTIKYLNFYKESTSIPKHTVWFTVILSFLCGAIVFFTFRNKNILYSIIGLIVPVIVAFIQSILDSIFSNSHQIMVDSFEIIEMTPTLINRKGKKEESEPEIDDFEENFSKNSEGEK